MNRYNPKQYLIETMRTRITTTFIGALDEFEQNFGYLWAHNEDREKTETEQQFFELYQLVRQNILDKGNYQRRCLTNEMNGFDIKMSRYTIHMPIKNNTDKEFK